MTAIIHFPANGKDNGWLIPSISSVCTHPEYTGQGLAALLMNVLIAEILGRGEFPFLHVRATNHRAIDLYRRLGFADCGVFHYVSVCKPAAQSRSAS